MEFPEEELLAPGHRGCAGCGAAIAVRLALKALGRNTVVACATGCLDVMTSPYPETAWEVPWIHVAFENAGAVASGVERALKAQGKEDVNVVAFGGDGGTADIGIQSLSGAMERGHDITYICYDNEAYMNTGIQRSGATPYGASTTTSPAGNLSFGEDKPKKNMAFIMAAHGIPYVATASISYPEDFMKKVKKAAGEFRVTYRPQERKPVVEYLSAQKRFRHLKEEQINEIQEFVDNQCEELGI